MTISSNRYCSKRKKKEHRVWNEKTGSKLLVLLFPPNVASAVLKQLRFLLSRELATLTYICLPSRVGLKFKEGNFVKCAVQMKISVQKQGN